MEEKKKFKVLKEGLGIDYNSLDNALFEQNLLMARLREENETLKANVEFLHQCLDDREKSIELMKEELNNLEDVKTVLGDIVMNLTKLDKLKKIVFKDDIDLEN